MPSVKLAWKRLIAESVAIVASILLAFALDASWDNHTARREETEELRRLEAEIKANVERFEAEIVGQESLLEHTDSLLGILERNAGASARVTVDNGLLLSLLFAPVVEPERSALDALVSSGGIQLISDRQVRERIAILSAQFADAQTQHTRARDLYMDRVLPYLSEHTEMTGLLRARRIDVAELRLRGGFPWTNAEGRTTLANTMELRNLVAQQRLFSGEALRASRETVEVLSNSLSVVAAAGP